MKKQTAITKAMMMEMCMWLCNMRMAWRAHFSAALPCSKVNTCAA